MLSNQEDMTFVIAIRRTGSDDSLPEGGAFSSNLSSLEFALDSRLFFIQL